MIHLLAAAMMSRPAGAAPPSGACAAFFGNNGSTAFAMGTGGGANVACAYNNSGDPADFIRFFVRVGGVTTQWSFNGPFGPFDSCATGALYSSASLGWVGAGTYEFWFTAERVSTGLFDVTSNTITLTVS